MATEETYRLSFPSAALAVLILAAMGVATLWDMMDGPGSPREEAVARTPEISLTLRALRKLPGDVRYYLSNHYALKDEVIDLDAQVKYGLLGREWTREVMLGEGGFLFLRNRNAVGQALGRFLADEAGLQAWRAHFMRTGQVFAERGVPFVFVAAPNKHAIYPDRLPSWLDTGGAAASLIGQVVAEARAAGVDAPDMTAYLTSIRTAPDAPLLYHRTDTHWTEHGAAMAMKYALAPAGFDLAVPVVAAQSVGRGGDLSRLTGLRPDPATTAPFIERSPSALCFEGDRPFELRTIDPPPVDQFTCRNDQAPHGDVVVFMDSFGVSAAPGLANAFRTSRFFWKDRVDLKIVDALRPDLVVQILVERKLPGLAPASLLLGAGR